MKKIIILLLGCTIISCNDKDKDSEPPVIADFNYEIDDTDYFKVHFTNFSENAISVLWDFGNGDIATLENPTYRYASEGLYDVTLTVFGANDTQDSETQVIALMSIPESPLRKLCGEQSKTWKLYREGSAVTLGPDSSQPDLWWEGFYNDGSRSCLYKHEFIFNKNGTFEFVDHNVFWGYNNIWPPEDPVYESCFEPSSDNMVVNNTDLSLWLSGIHNFEFFSSNGIVLHGKGAWIGFPFIGTSAIHGINMPDSVAFTVGFEQLPSFDLMTVNFDHHSENGYWTFRYVSYHDWQDEPPLIE